jgi:hypothetical protein
MVQQIEPPEFLKALMAQLPELQPSELLNVSLRLRPLIDAVGEGEPIIAEGAVTLFGFPAPLPLPILLQVTRRGEALAKPVAFGFTAPFIGTFRITVATDGWPYDQYAFQALAFIPPAPPGLSQPKFKGIEAPRYSAEVRLVIPEGMTPGTIDLEAGVSHTVRVDYTISNTGNASDSYTVTHFIHCPELAASFVGTQESVSLAPGDSVSGTGMTVSVPATAGEGYYDGVVRVTSPHIALVEDRKLDVFHIMAFTYGASITGVSWY